MSHFDPTTNTALQWEIDWIMSHPDGYDGPMHQKAVCGNVTKRYAMNELLRHINAYADTHMIKDQIALFEYVGKENN